MMSPCQKHDVGSGGEGADGLESAGDVVKKFSC